MSDIVKGLKDAVRHARRDNDRVLDQIKGAPARKARLADQIDPRNPNAAPSADNDS